MVVPIAPIAPPPQTEEEARSQRRTLTTVIFVVIAMVFVVPALIFTFRADASAQSAEEAANQGKRTIEIVAQSAVDAACVRQFVAPVTNARTSLDDATAALVIATAESNTALGDGLIGGLLLESEPRVQAAIVDRNEALKRQAMLIIATNELRDAYNDVNDRYQSLIAAEAERDRKTFESMCKAGP